MVSPPSQPNSVGVHCFYIFYYLMHKKKKKKKKKNAPVDEPTTR
jgi:hypothetical protein